MRFWILLLALSFFPMASSAEDPLLSNVLMVRPLELDTFTQMLIQRQLTHIGKTYPELNVKLPLPNINVATEAYMKDLYKRLSDKEAKVEALYVHTDLDLLTNEEIQSRTIYLSIEWAPDNAVKRALLYHELVHYVQYMNLLDMVVDCVEVLEFHAYEATATYLVEVEGLSDRDLNVIENRRDATAQGACPEKVKHSK